MSTDYVTADEALTFDQLKDLRVGDIEARSVDRYSLILVDGQRSVLWAYRNGGSVFFTRYSRNNPDYIIAALERHFSIRFVSDEDDEYYQLTGLDEADDGQDAKTQAPLSC